MNLTKTLQYRTSQKPLLTTLIIRLQELSCLIMIIQHLMIKIIIDMKAKLIVEQQEEII